MKIVLIRKAGDPKKVKYYDAAILIEPLRKQEEFEPYLIGNRNGTIQEITQGGSAGLVYTFYEILIDARYQRRVYEWVLTQVGKKVAVCRWWHRLFKQPELVQNTRKERKVWTMPELIFAALNLKTVGIPLFCNYMPQEMTAEFLSKSPALLCCMGVRVEKDGTKTPLIAGKPIPAPPK